MQLLRVIGVCVCIEIMRRRVVEWQCFSVLLGASVSLLGPPYVKRMMLLRSLMSGGADLLLFDLPIKLSTGAETVR